MISIKMFFNDIKLIIVTITVVLGTTAPPPIKTVKITITRLSNNGKVKTKLSYSHQMKKPNDTLVNDILHSKHIHNYMSILLKIIAMSELNTHTL